MRRAFKRLALTLAAAVAVLLIYRVAVEPRFILDDRRYDISLPHLAAGADGTRIAVFADLQIGMWLDNPGMVERVVDCVLDERPAAALIAGDFLYSADPGLTEQIDTVLELLAPLTAAKIPELLTWRGLEDKNFL